MTVQETREEYKQMEGDPKIKGRIRAIRSERSRKRMMANVPKATVVITNPTHYAVALQYDKSMAAPLCLAKGVDAVAFRIRALAEENEVPIVENPPLARALYGSVEVDETIPTEHFKAVAHVIGFVMRLKQKPRWQA
jgi:flagellar biosynthetic protein FlhB